MKKNSKILVVLMFVLIMPLLTLGCNDNKTTNDLHYTIYYQVTPTEEGGEGLRVYYCAENNTYKAVVYPPLDEVDYNCTLIETQGDIKGYKRYEYKEDSKVVFTIPLESEVINEDVVVENSDCKTLLEAPEKYDIIYCVEPTENKAGIEVYRCRDCGEEVFQFVPVLNETNYTLTFENGFKKYSNEKYGEYLVEMK